MDTSCHYPTERCHLKSGGLRMYVYQNGNSSIFKVVELIKLRNPSYTYVKFTTESNSMHNRYLLTTSLSENVLKHWLFIPGIGKMSA